MPPDLPPLNALRAFEAVVRCGGVARAATELHVTHGAVSRQLRLLEEAAGAALFARSGRGLTVTYAGRQLHEDARAAFDQLRASWRTLAGAGKRPLVLGCPGSLLARWLIPRLGRLGQAPPGLSLHLAAREEPLDPALAGLDAALLLAAPPWPDAWVVTVLAVELVGPVLSPRYAGWSTLRGKGPAALAREPVLRARSRPQAWNDWAKASGVSLKSTSGLEFPHLYHLLQAATAGLGVGIAPAPLVSDDLADGRLLAPWGFTGTGASWILARPRRRPDPRIDALTGWLATELADPAPAHARADPPSQPQATL